jgi:ABC-type nitrate/sulfonate/bicarbonate transport system ATPase subunit
MEYSFHDEILSIENVSLKFGDHLVLRDINVKINDIKRPSGNTGQIVGLLAPSGRGKTQLFNIMAGLIQPTTGTVLLNNKTVNPGDVGVVAQHYPLLAHRTVYKNLDIALHKSTLSQSEKSKKILFYLERFKLLDKKDSYPQALSGGQRQRIAIIQQLLCSENFLLLDEPFSGLDINMIAELSEIILEIANLEDKNCIVIVSHDIRSTIAIANELWIMGYEQDESGNNIPGATIKYTKNLMDAGIAWNYPHCFDTPAFQDSVKQIRNLFPQL